LIKTTNVDIAVSKKILILGDSNSECAINDSIYKSSINLSASADSYFYSYLKLKKVMNTNEIDTLLLSFSPHNIFNNGGQFNDSYIYSRFKVYYPLMDENDFRFLIKNNPFAVFKSTPPIIKVTLENSVKVILNKPIHYGKFNLLNRNILIEVQEKLKNGKKLPFFEILEKLIISKHEIEYLNKIVSFCKKEKIKLFLVNTPKRKELLEYPKYGVMEFNKFYDLNYSDIVYLDFSQLKMSNDFYGDFVHLNMKGSTYFSNLLKNEGLAKLTRKYKRTVE